jgi:hypothetical protein
MAGAWTYCARIGGWSEREREREQREGGGGEAGQRQAAQQEQTREERRSWPRVAGTWVPVLGGASPGAVT